MRTGVSVEGALAVDVAGGVGEGAVAFGEAGHAAAAADADWREAGWAERHGLYASLHDSIGDLDAAVEALVRRIAGFSSDAMIELKRAFWQGTDDWETLLEERAAISARLVLTEQAQRTIQGMRQR